MLGISAIEAQMEGYEFEYPYSKDVTRIVEDTSGYLWFHDEKDFYRYNGHQVEALGLAKVIKRKKFDYNFTGDLIFAKNGLLYEDQGSLWTIDPRTKAVKLFWEATKGERIDHYYEDDNGDIWVFASQRRGSARPVYKLTNKGNSTRVFDLYDHIGSRGIFWDFEVNDAEGIFYIHWRLGGLVMIDSAGKKIELNPKDQVEFNDKFPCSLFRLDNKNRLWRIYNDEFTIYDFGDRKFDVHPLSDKARFWNECNKSQTPALLNLRFLYEDRSGNIWLACAASYLVMYDEKLNENFLFRKPLVDELQGGNYDIKSLTEDKNGNLWGNKQGGLFKIRKKASYFTAYAKDTKSPDHPIYSTDDPVVSEIFDFFHEFGIKNTAVHSISEDENGNLYFQDATLTFKVEQDSIKLEILPIFTKKEKVFLSMESGNRLMGVYDAYYNIDLQYRIEKAAIPINKIEKLYVQRNGRVWLAGLLNLHDFMFGELDKSSDNFLGNFENKSGIDFNKVKVNDIQEDEQGNLWLGTNEGLLHVDLHSLQIKDFNRKVSQQGKSYEIGRVIDQIQFVDIDRLWFKSKYEVGLLNIETREIEALLHINASISGDDLVFVPEGDSILWLGENEGLRYHNFQSGESFRISREEGVETAGKVYVMKRLLDGNIAVGTGNGLYLFNPTDVLINLRKQVLKESKTTVNLLSYKYVDGKIDSTVSHSFLNGIDNIVLNYNDRSLALTYAMADFKYPRRHLYRHKLAGYENEWSIPHTGNNTAYTSLPYGSYKFMVEGNIGNGNWISEKLEIPITVRQAWFRTWWFIIGILVAFGVIIYLLMRYNFRQKLKRRIEMEGLRTKISSDLHDDVGSMLSGLAMQSEVMGLRLSDEDKKTAMSISEMSRAAIDKMRDIVWALDSRRDKYENLLDRMQAFALNTLVRAEIEYTFTVNGIAASRFINPEHRQNIYLIFKEALTNVVKHSNGKQVKILFESKNEELRLVIHDNGVKSPMLAGDGLGLSNMQMRAKRLNGELSISDSEGFEIKLVVPQ